jgi:PKHD-type hydroxylase
MKFNTLSNRPRERACVTTGFVTISVFPPPDLQRLKDYCESLPLQRGLNTKDQEVQNRKSDIRFVYPDSTNQWMFDRFNEGLTYINNNWYGFDLNGYEYFQYTTYKAEEAGFYNWHVDMGFNDNRFVETRKLSMSMVLNDDFEGGLFQMRTEDIAHTVETPPGALVVFPSFMAHRVTPVTKGVRKSIVVWVVGPKWR